MGVLLWVAGVVVVIIDIAAIVDVIRRPDLAGGARILWVLLILVLPLIGAIAYLIARPRIVDYGDHPDAAKRAVSELRQEQSRDSTRDTGLDER